ncbi:hypothetical protein [Saccharomonospora amisosensis]|uniref:hypothetical protein n=1 Tax=Saccharomonospora amisosensis TaxID=1128677 RepID=UPI00142372EC|nr:hypothetical protein [Saccharomonospora amisosensis]
MSGPGLAEVSAAAAGESTTESRTESRNTVARLAALPGVSTASVVARAADRAQVTGQVLPVLPALADLLPRRGLRRGSTVAVRGSISLLLALLAEATTGGHWAAVVGIPRLGLAAASELGVEVNRLALVPRPGADFAPVTAALLDGLDLVATASPERTQEARRLSARARHRGAVLLSFGPWPGAEVELRCLSSRWTGLDHGHGYLREREVLVDVVGRGAVTRPSRTALLLPGPGGVVRRVGHTEGVAPAGVVKAG